MPKRRKPPREHRSRYPLTRLGRFMKLYRVRSTDLWSVSRVSRQHIYRLRHGLMDPTLRVMVRVRDGCIAILGRRVWLSELFDVQEDDLLLQVQPSCPILDIDQKRGASAP